MTSPARPTTPAPNCKHMNNTVHAGVWTLRQDRQNGDAWLPTRACGMRRSDHSYGVAVDLPVTCRSAACQMVTDKTPAAAPRTADGQVVQQHGCKTTPFGTVRALQIAVVDAMTDQAEGRHLDAETRRIVAEGTDALAAAGIDAATLAAKVTAKQKRDAAEARRWARGMTL